MCDLRSSNSASLKNVFGVTEKTPYFYHNSHKLYCFFDSPHLIKNVRNTLYGSDMVVENEVTLKSFTTSKDLSLMIAEQLLN